LTENDLQCKMNKALLDPLAGRLLTGILQSDRVEELSDAAT